jgi:hypothetical protein
MHSVRLFELIKIIIFLMKGQRKSKNLVKNALYLTDFLTDNFLITQNKGFQRFIFGFSRDFSRFIKGLLLVFCMFFLILTGFSSFLIVMVIITITISQ